MSHTCLGTSNSVAKKSFQFPTDVYLFNIIRIIFPMRLNKALFVLNGGKKKDHQTFFFSEIALGVRMRVGMAGTNNWKTGRKGGKGDGEGGREEGSGR